MRTCARSGCNSPAVATLSYDRIALVAYLVTADDTAAREPGDLCERHTAKLVLPREWQLDDRRVDATAAPEDETEAPAPAPKVKKLRVVKDAAPTTASAKPARAKKPRAAARPKWTAPEPSLFDATSDTVAPLPAAREEAATEPVWMPRFDRDDEGELEGVLDAKTPLLRRAFGGR